MFHPTYASVYECHDERFGVFSCHGYLTSRRSTLSVGNVVTTISVRAVTGIPEWNHYLERLKTWLSDQLTGDQRIKLSPIFTARLVQWHGPHPRDSLQAGAA